MHLLNGHNGHFSHPPVAATFPGTLTSLTTSITAISACDSWLKVAICYADDMALQRLQLRFIIFAYIHKYQKYSEAFQVYIIYIIGNIGKYGHCGQHWHSLALVCYIVTVAISDVTAKI